MTKPSPELKKEWDKKLKDSGFKDIEVEVNGNRCLRQRAIPSLSKAARETFKQKAEYYLTISKKFVRQKFPNDLELMVMNHHADGKKIKEIQELLLDYGFKKHRTTITFIIRRWQKRWRLKNWTPKQMNLKKDIS